MYDAVLIDDEPWARETLKRIGDWRALGFRVIGEASDGQSGLECVRSLRPDLIVMDMNMPGLDGAELLRELSAEGSRAKVIVISGYDDFRYTRQAMLSKAVDYLLKPVKPGEFNALLSRCAAELAIDAEDARREPDASQFDRVEQLSLLGTVDAAWMRQYGELLDVVATCLISGSADGMDRVFSMIESSLKRVSGEYLGIRLLVRVNYDFLTLFENSIINHDLDNERALRPDAVSFPLSGHVPPEELTAHWRRAFRSVLTYARAKDARKGRIDVDEIREWIEARYDQPLTLESVAARFSVSREYLSSQFRKETGTTFTAHLTSIRMERLKELITVYGLPIQRAAESAGYVDISSFYRAFKKYFGLTPGEVQGLWGDRET